MRYFLKEVFYRKKIWVSIILFLLLIVVSSCFLFFYFMNTEDIILRKDLSCHFREKVQVSEFIQKLDGELLNDYLVDTNEVGLKKIEVSYKNHYGLVMRKKFTIEVIDVTPPTVIVANPYIVEKGSIEKLENTIFCADDFDDNVICEITGEYDLQKVGNYDLKIMATDASANRTSKEFTLQVIEEIKGKKSNENKTPSITKFASIYKKYKNDNTMIGLDISKWQQEVDFSKLKEEGVEFVMLKLGGQSEIGGEITIDPKFYENIEKALENELQVGIYFYSYAKSEKEVQKQAKWVVQKLKGYPITLPIAFDWENWNQYTTFHISFHTLNKIAGSFLKEIEKNGYDGMLYSSKYYLETIWYASDYTNWIAYYTNDFDYEGEYVMWQVCNDGKIAGIDGYVDIDVMYLEDK